MTIIYEYISSSSSYVCDVTTDRAIQLKDGSRRNALVWEDCGVDNSHAKIVTAHLQLTDGASQQNGGLVLNYHLVDPFTSPRYEYFIAQLNRITNKIELVRFNGSVLIVENSATPSLPLELEDWYQVQAETTDLGGGNTRVTVTVTGITDPAWPQVSFSLTTSLWGDPDGHFGIHATRAVTNFSFWRIEDA